MKTITLEYFKNNFDLILDEVRSGKSFIINSGDNNLVIIKPYKKDV